MPSNSKGKMRIPVPSVIEGGQGRGKYWASVSSLRRGAQECDGDRALGVSVAPSGHLRSPCYQVQSSKDGEQSCECHCLHSSPSVLHLKRPQQPELNEPMQAGAGEGSERTWGGFEGIIGIRASKHVLLFEHTLPCSPSLADSQLVCTPVFFPVLRLC